MHNFCINCLGIYSNGTNELKCQDATGSGLIRNSNLKNAPFSCVFHLMLFCINAIYGVKMYIK